MGLDEEILAFILELPWFNWTKPAVRHLQLTVSQRMHHDAPMNYLVVRNLHLRHAYGGALQDHSCFFPSTRLASMEASALRVFLTTSSHPTHLRSKHSSLRRHPSPSKLTDEHKLDERRRAVDDCGLCTLDTLIRPPPSMMNGLMSRCICILFACAIVDAPTLLSSFGFTPRQ
jgi:hypothetical protein